MGSTIDEPCRRPWVPGRPGNPPRQLTIRPGLTGPWRQVEDLSEQAILDLYYIRNYTIALDLQVLFHTARELVHRLFGEADGLARWDEPQREAVSLPSEVGAAPSAEASVAAPPAADAPSAVESRL